MWVGLIEREREWSEEKNGRWRKTEGKRERSVNSNQRSRALRIECVVHESACAHVCASPPSLAVTVGAADQTTLNKRKPFPSLLRSQCGAYVCACVRAVEWLRLHMCVQQRNGAREEEVGVGVGGTGRRRLTLSSVPALDGAR